jgi:molybdopterin synthase sulfur carrier subunit
MAAMKIKIRYFASLREAMGTSQEELDTQAVTVGQLRDQLLGMGDKYQCLQRDQAVRMALNQVMVDESGALLENAELAFFPPVTGG